MEMPLNHTIFFKGKEAFLNNDLKEAEYFFSQSYKNERNPKSLWYLLYIYLLQSEYEKIARLFLLKKIEIRGFGLYPVYWVKYLSGDLDEALEILERMMEEDHYFVRIFAIKELSKFKKIDNVDEFIKDRFKYFGLSYEFPIEEQRASLYLDFLSKRYHLSMIQAKSLLKDYPEISDVYLDYLEICFAVGTEEAKKEALKNEAILEKAKTDYRVMWLLAREFYQRKEFDLSKEYISRLLSVFRHNPLFYYNLGNIFFNKGKYIKAIECYTLASELAPLFDRVYHNLGVLYYKIGEINKAIKNFEKAISISKNPKAIYNMAICLIERKDYEEAYHYLNKIPNWYNAKNSPFYLKEKIKEILFDSLIS